MIIKYDRETYKILGYYTGNIKDIKLNENEALKELNIQDCSQVDIRVYNEDGSCKSLEQQIKEKVLVLKDNETIQDGIVIKLNPSYMEDYIELVERGIKELDDDKKIAYDNVSKEKYITEKNLEEKLIDNLISVEEYNKNVINNRKGLYSTELDSVRAELLDLILNRLSNEGKLTDTETELLKSIEDNRIKIKRDNPKK